MNKDFFYKLRLIFFPCQDNKYRPKLLNGDLLLYYGAVLLLLKLIIIPFICYFPQTGFFADLTKTGLFELSNFAREQLDLKPLNESPVLDTAAYLKAKDMMEKGYFAHYSPEGTTPWYWLNISGYGYRTAGENLAIGFLESGQVHSAWMDSSSHKKNILNPDFQEMGIAVLKDNFQGRETTLVVQFFGTQKTIISEEEVSQPPVEITEEKTEIQGGEITPEVLPEVPIVVSEEREEVSGEVTSPELEEVVFVPVTEKTERTPAFVLFQFIMSDYYNLIQKIIYGSLLLIIICLIITVFCDIFIYHKFEIQYKDAILKTVGFSALWFILLFLDKMIIIELINPQNFMIY